MSNNSFRVVEWSLVMLSATIAAGIVTSDLPEDSTARATEPQLSIVSLEHETLTRTSATTELNRTRLISGSFSDGYMSGLTALTQERAAATIPTGTSARKPSR